MPTGKRENKGRIAMHSKLILGIGLGGFLVAGMTNSAFGSGFALIEQSVRLQGYAYAGAAAVADDASTVFFNPAGMSKIEGKLLTAGFQIVAPQAEFNNQGSTHALQGLTTIPLIGNNGGDGGETGLVPSLFYVANLNNGWSYGLGVNAPFGLATEYDQGWVGRYHAIKSEVKTVNINPSASYRFNKHLSLGAGINLQYIDAEVTNAIDFGTLDAAGAFAAAGLPAGALGLTPQQSDGKVTLKGDDWSFGFNIGLLYECNNGNSRLGLAYRSQMKHKLEGDALFDVPPPVALLQSAGQFSNSNVTSEIELPASASLSIYHRLSQQVGIMADVSWTDWSSLQELRFDFDNNMADGVTTLQWKDSFRYSLGAMYNPNERLTLRCGIALDKTPIPNAIYRTPRIPGEDRTWLSAGAGYKINDRISVDGAYSHLFVDDPKIDKPLGTPTSENFFRGGLKGEYDASVDITSIQANFLF